ncbi:hypothetical protein Godav_028448 [Gossypium davidsonii]|uniref:RNase H type-1 domain-containing protein n=2 Tax=Gossypium TaxID=3633 RepID=A0A7J8S0W1_GOSDV|nr:hypothetical protein [Gossypium davidsonii]MBA0654616.1 hypothetical protein [Gossypium klotzschianum]
MTAACWSVWLARNKLVFERKWSTTNSLLFHSKMRALMWVRYGWVKFNVSGVANEDEVECGAVLRDSDGVARALFSGLVATKDYIKPSWFENKRLRPWLLQSIFKDIENRMVRVGNVSFSKAEKHGNDLAYALALTGIKRHGMF